MPIFRGAGSQSHGIARHNFTFGQGHNSGNAIIDPDALAWRAVVIGLGGTVSDVRLLLVSNTITYWKLTGVWPVMSNIWLTAAENTFSALVDLVARTVAAEVGVPAFAIDRGYTVSKVGGDNYITTNTLGGPNYTQNSANFGFWCRTDMAVEDGVMMGTSDFVSDHVSNLSVAWSDGNLYYAINDGNTDSGRPKATNTIGHWVVDRSGVSADTVSQNGSLFSSTGITSTTVPTQNWPIGGSINHSGVNDQLFNVQTPQFAAAHLGGHLTSGQISDLYIGFQNYMTAVGA